MDIIALAIGSLVWGAVLVGIAIALQTAVRISGAARQALWRIVATLIVAPWLIAPVADWAGIGLPAPAPVVAPIEAVETLTAMDATPVAGLATTAVEPVVPAKPIPWQAILIAIIAAGWIWRVIAARLAARALNRIVAASIEAGDGPARRSLEAWSRRLNLNRAPGLLIVAEGLSPFSFGAVRAVICLPEGLDRQLDAEALDLVVGHECLHVARGDGWLRPVERLVADLLWFNPFAWHVRRELDVARELACDEAVLKHSNAHRAYAHTLRNVAGITAGLGASAPAASMSLAGSPRSLMLRVKQALSDAKAKPARAALVGVALVALAGIPVACVQGVAAAPRVAAKSWPDIVCVAPKAEPVLASADPLARPKPKLVGETCSVLGGRSRVISGFGFRIDPFINKTAFHEGVDLEAAIGAPIHAPAAGKISFAGVKGTFGKVIEIEFDNNQKIRFGHLDQIQVATGDTVNAGDLIGTAGESGRTTGGHLHLEFYLRGKSYDPAIVENLKFAASLDEPQVPPAPPAAPTASARPVTEAPPAPPVTAPAPQSAAQASSPRASAEVEARIAEATRSLAETKRRFEQGTVSRAQLWEAEDALAIAEAAIADMKAGSEPGKGIASAEAQLQAATHQAAAAKLSYAMSRQQQSSYDDAVAMAQAAVADAKAGSEPGKGVATAEVQLQVAIRQAQETKRLFDLGAASQGVLSSREAAVRLAQARLADLQAAAAARAPQPTKALGTPATPKPAQSPATPSPSAVPIQFTPPAPVVSERQIKAWYPGRVTVAGPGSEKGFRVKLTQTADTAEQSGCETDLDGLTKLSVKTGQALKVGDVIGSGVYGSFNFGEQCKKTSAAVLQTAFPDRAQAEERRFASGGQSSIRVGGYDPSVSGREIKAWYPAKVAVADGDSQTGYKVRLVQTRNTDRVSDCTVTLSHMHGLKVQVGQVLAAGDVIGTGAPDRMSFETMCRETIGATGRSAMLDALP